MRVLSGGQTGVDRAALDAALALGIPCGGWCPQGRLAEDGAVPPRYPLQETPLASSHQRTVWNVRDAEATLVLARGSVSGGTALAVLTARRLGRPLLVADLDAEGAEREVVAWIGSIRPASLNVAGPRESQSPGVEAAALAFLLRVFARLESRETCP